MAARSMTFENTVTLGGLLSPILTALAFLGMYIAYHFRRDKNVEIAALVASNRFAAIEMQLASIVKVVAGIETVLRNQAEHNVRIEQIEKLVDELRHGKGYVLEMEPHRRNFGPGAT